MFDFLFIGTFNSWVICQTSKEGRRYYEQERLFNLIFNHYYLPISIFVIHSTNIEIKKIT